MIKRIRLDRFHIKYIEGKPQLFHDVKNLTQQGIRIRAVEKEAIQQTAANVITHSPFFREVTLEDVTSLAAQIRVILQECLRLENLKLEINKQTSSIREEGRFPGYYYFGLHAVENPDTENYLLNALFGIPYSRRQIQLSSVKPESGAMVVFTQVNNPYVDICSKSDLPKLYSKFLYLGKV